MSKSHREENLDIFAIHLSSRHEKPCQMCVRLVCLFQCSSYQQCNAFFSMKPYTILKRTCQNENRRHFMDKTQGRLCLLLDEFEDYFSGLKSCKDWPENFFVLFDKPNDTLVEEM